MVTKRSWAGFCGVFVHRLNFVQTKSPSHSRFIMVEQTLADEEIPLTNVIERETRARTISVKSMKLKKILVYPPYHIHTYFSYINI